MIKLEYFDRQDFKKLIEWVNNEHVLTNWAGSLFKFPLTDDSLDWYIEDTNDLNTSDAFIYKAIDTDSGGTVGHISLGSISQKNRSGRISRVLVDPAQRSKGACAGMITGVLHVGFEKLNLHRISLGVYDFNHAAIRCYEKCGFKKEGLMRDVLLYESKAYWSLWEMSILQEEWRLINH